MSTVISSPARGLLRMSLADVARAAGVQRAVVSMWRKRPSPSGVSFPEPVGERDGHPEFDAPEIADYLRATSRGNNPTASDDIALFSRPGLELTGVSASVLSALLAIAARSGERLTDLDSQELADLAAELDPRDSCLRTEIERALPVGIELLQYADELADAAYSPQRALEVVLGDDVRRRGGTHRRRMLHQDAIRLISGVAVAVGRAVGLDPLRFVDPTASEGSLLWAAAADVPDATCGSPAAARGARRRLLAHGVETQVLAAPDGELDLGAPAVVLTQLPTDGDDDGIVRVLDELDQVTLAMSPSHWGVLVAPSAVLTDKLPASLVSRRDQVLRDGRLRMVVRLPARLLVHQGQAHLALWVFGPPADAVHPEHRVTVVGDLSDVALDDAVIDEMITDAVTSLASTELMRTRSFHRSVVVPTRQLLVRRDGLVADALPSPLVTPRGDREAVRIERLRARAGEVGVGWAAYAPADSEVRRRVVALGQARKRGALRVWPGTRLSDHEVTQSNSGGVVVIGEVELAGTGSLGARRADLLDLTAAHPRAHLTEPGDVVFCTARGVTAVVDAVGGAVVQSPARILRITGPCAGGVLVSEVVAADLRAQPVAAKAFDSWPLRLIDPDVVATLKQRLRELRMTRDDLAARLTIVDTLGEALIDGIATGEVTIMATDHHGDTAVGEQDS